MNPKVGYVNIVIILTDSRGNSIYFDTHFMFTDIVLFKIAAVNILWFLLIVQPSSKVSPDIFTSEMHGGLNLSSFTITTVTGDEELKDRLS